MKASASGTPRHTDYKVTNTPYGKDLLRPFVEAFRAEGLRVGFYYSLIDWHHPDFPIDPHHPQRNQPRRSQDQRRGATISRYAAYHARAGDANCLTQFGKIDVIWFDFTYPQREAERLSRARAIKDWESEALVRHCPPSFSPTSSSTIGSTSPVCRPIS